MDRQSGRINNRTDVEWEAKVRGKGLGIMPAIVRNVSLGGMFVETSAEFKVEDRIMLESHIEYAGKSRRLLVECEIMHCTSTEKSEMRGYGIRFSKLGRDNLSILLPVVAGLWAQQKNSNIHVTPSLSTVG